MDVDIPPWLQWVSYLAGGEWPQGSETGMFRIQEHLQAAAADLDELIPELNRVRGETLSVLHGETAQAAGEHFAMLFDGDYAVDKLSDGIRALGESSGYTGSEIEYSKLSILVGLALAAAEISYALAMAGPTLGASTAAIPAIEWVTVTTIRQLVSLLLKRLAAKVRETLARTTVKRLIYEGFQEAGQELAIAGTQEGIVYGLQGDRYNVNGERLLLNGIASTVGGGAGGVTAVPTANFLGPAATRAGAAVKGGTTFFTAGVVGNLAGTAAVGGDFDPFMILMSSSTSSIGGLGGAGVAPGANPSTQSGNRPADDGGSPPDGERPPTGPLDDGDNPAADTGADTDAERDDTSPADDNSTNGHRQDDTNQADGTNQADSTDGARAADTSAGDSAPESAGEMNTAAQQSDSSTETSQPSADHLTSGGDTTTESSAPSTRADSTSSDTPAQPPEGATLTGTHSDTGSDLSGQDPVPGLPVADVAPEPTLDGEFVNQAAADPTSSPGPDAGPTTVSTTPTVDISATTDTTPAADGAVPTSPAANNAGTTAAPTAQGTSVPTTAASTPPSAVPQSTSTTPQSTTAPSQSTSSTTRPSVNPPTISGQQDTAEAAKAGASTSAVAPSPAARASDTTAQRKQQDSPETNTEEPAPKSDKASGTPHSARRTDCLDRIAEKLSAKLGRPIRLGSFASPQGRPAVDLYAALGCRAEFASYTQVEEVLGTMESGSFAIVTSAWTGGPDRGGHAYLAVNENGRVRFEDAITDTQSGWPPHWGEGAVLRTAVGYVHSTGEARQTVDDVRDLVAAAAIGDVQGSPTQGDTPADDGRTPGERWRDVVPHSMVAESALERRGLTPARVDELINPLGLMEAASARARDNSDWWAGLTGAEQRALIDTYPHQIGNAEGIPASARHEANTRSLEHDRKELQARRERGEWLTRSQRRQLARLNRIHQQLTEAGESAERAGVGGPQLLAFDPFAFGGDGRAVVSFGADPYRAESVSWHVPGLKMNIDQLGPCMGDALKHLQSTLHENPNVAATSIAWIGYDTPTSVLGAARHTAAREGAAILYSDIRAFNAARDAWAGDGSHFRGNHVFAHSYGSTTAGYAGRDGRLANDIRTMTLIGSPGAGPVQRAAEFGSDVDVYVASSSRDPIAGLGSRLFGAAGRIFGINLGIDPAMDSFGAQRITAEFSADMDRRRNWGTHLAYYKYVDRTTDPAVRSESLANFGRIAAGHPDRLDLEAHRTIEDRALRRPHLRTIEPAAGRTLRLEGDTEQSSDRQTRRPWNPRWRAESAAVEPSQVDDATPALDPSTETDEDQVATPLDPDTAKEIADQLLADRGIKAAELMSPATHRAPVGLAVARAEANGQWWKGLSPTQRQAMIQAYPHEVGNSEGIPPMARHAANSLMLQTYLSHRDVLVSRLDNGVEINRKQQRFVDLMRDIEDALRSAEHNAARAGVGGPYLLALDPRAFGGAGRAIVSFGADPYTAESVSWYVPGMTTTIDKLRAMMLRGFNQLQSTRRENPNLTAASITYIGYKAPGSWDPRVTSQKMAQQGGQIFCGDLLAFNAGRDVFASDGSHFSGNHVFAHSYGSTTVSHAGAGQRLADQVRTITLIGSPGAGPLQHAADFGIGADNVFVAASSRDRTTGLGGERPGERGRLVRSIGQGIDPAMDSFGAQRITAEFPAALDHMGRGSRMTHSLYWAYMDPGADPQVRSESLTNFGRIAAGQAHRVALEGHRTLGARPRFLREPGEGTVEPAIGRPLRLVDDPTANHPVDRRRPWNPRFTNLPSASIQSPPVDNGGGADTTGALPPGELPAPDVEQVPASAKLVADVALADRGITAADLMSPADHRVRVAQAVARAEATAHWWQGLSEAQQQALIQAYPHQVGNAEGIPPMARHQANSLMLQTYLAHRDLLMSRRDNGVALKAVHERFIELMNNIESGLRTGQRNAHRTGVGGPYLLALDPRAFGGVGRAIISFGADPYTADSVSWYVPGMSTTIDKVRMIMLRAFNHLQSTLQESPGLNAASIAYIGYQPPGSWDPRVTSQRMARNGGEIFCSDLLSFNVGRDVFAGDGSHFSGNHVFAHSYGSSTVSHAGAGQRLAPHVQTITLIGSPGAGPLQHAADFGIGADNVFVAASSRDRTTGLGGDRPGRRGRLIRNLGQGVDPAMDSFGARRITAEFPAALDRSGRGSRMTHSLYWAYMDPGLSPHVRSESLANFGRIAAGRADQVDVEGHRTLGERPRWFRRPAEGTVEPAIGRPLRLADDPAAFHPVNRRNPWNPNFLREGNCAVLVAGELSARYGRDIRLAVDASPRGVPAWRLFQAVGSSSQFATYAEVEATLRRLGDGSSAVLASRWRGWGQSGHAFLAVNDGGEIYCVDPHSGERSGWPPSWGEQSVRRTAVGYLDANGDPVARYDGTTRGKFDAAGSIGYVRGQPVPTLPAGDLVNPLGAAELAAERARANAAWWASLSEAQRQALIESHPHRIGNAEGIPATDRDAANRRVLQQYRDRADQVQTKIDEFDSPNRQERNFLDRVNRIEAALQKAAADAARAGVGGPLLLAFDSAAFGGDGRVVLSFGADPYTAANVSWHTGSEPIDKLGTVVGPALDQLESPRREPAAAIVWLGDSKTNPVLHSDLAAFHAVRDGNAGVRVHTQTSPTSVSTAVWAGPDTGSTVVAHRGASHEFPEQTLAAYREALRQGARALECDVRLTKDGHLVCIHDKRVDRTSNGTGLVGDMTLAELRELDFGGWHPSREQAETQSETGILTLEELVKLVAAHDQPVTLFIETKHPDKGGWKLEREVVALLERYGMADPASPEAARAAVISFYPDALWRVRRAAPNLPTVLLGPSAPYLATTVGATAIGPSIKVLRANPELVDAAAAKGLSTYCWTVNDPHDVQYARDLGVSFIATDHPARTGELLHGDSAPDRSAEQPAPVEAPQTPNPEATRAVAEVALAQRIPPVRPDELRNPLGITEEAVARARNNAAWWTGLTDDQRQALISTYPQHIGNAEGIPAADRDSANRLVLQQLRESADTVQSKIDAGERPSRTERTLLRRVNQLESALRKASVDAERAGVGTPLLLAFDPAEFGGDGRAVLSFGDDPYQAESVSWHAPGIQTTVHSLFGFYTRSALNHLQSVKQENPTLKAASIAWIGYDTPSGRGLGHTFRQTAARTGGDILYSDIRAFNAGRDAWAGDGSRFTGNHVYGYSYGSTTAAYAGRDGRLAGHISTVSLVGSPGAGPMRHASEFGAGVDVYVASSSRDVVTAQGGRAPGSSSRLLGSALRILGLGVDPAMDSFGAVRVTAEFPDTKNFLRTGGTHHAYFLNTEPGVRSESQANLGRIAAGHPERLELEQHRTVDGRRTIEPAAERAGPRRFWNPRWGRVPNCAKLVVDELSAIYGRDFHLAVSPSRRGVPARALFEALGCDADFATYTDVENALRDMPSGSSAVLVSRWSGGRQGGHAYLARIVDGQIHLVDTHTGERSGWPPHWGQDAVARTAVGYLDANGDPVGRFSVDIPLRLDAADAVGRVQGLPADHDFGRRQAEYRGADPGGRRVDTRYAAALGDVVDNATDDAVLAQFAQDLSGEYGPFRVEFTASVLGGGVMLVGDIFNGDNTVGQVQLEFDRDAAGKLVVYETGTNVTDPRMRGRGFYRALHTELESYYQRSGVDRIESGTHDQGTKAAAGRGFVFDSTPARLDKVRQLLTASAHNLIDGGVSAEGQRLLAQVLDGLRSGRPPKITDLAYLNSAAEPDLGAKLLAGAQFPLAVVKYFQAELPPSGLKAWFRRTLGIGGDARTDTVHDCAHRVGELVSAMYGRDVRLPGEPPRRGVPARTMFEAVGSASEFATYDEVAQRLRQLGDGSSAILASQWAGTGARTPGHAYLARNIGGEIHLIDPFTGARSAWPPYWGQDAVVRTAAGYLGTNGEPVNRLDIEVPLRLDAAEAIGRVKGHPEEYRAQDRSSRVVDPRYAEPLGDVVDDATNLARIRQLAQDLSGMVGPYRVELTTVDDDGTITIDGNRLDGRTLIQGIQRDIARDQDGNLRAFLLTGAILDGDEVVGAVHRTFYRDPDGNLVVFEDGLILGEEHKGRGFSKALIATLAPFYRSSDVDRVELLAGLDNGGYAWARRGFAWDLHPSRLRESLDNIRKAAQQLAKRVGPEAREVLRELIDSLDPENPDLPEPIDLADLTAPGEPELGRKLMNGSQWWAVMYMR